MTLSFVSVLFVSVLLVQIAAHLRLPARKVAA